MHMVYITPSWYILGLAFYAMISLNEGCCSHVMLLYVNQDFHLVKLNTKGDTCGVGSGFLSEALEFTPWCWWARVAQSLILYVVFRILMLVFWSLLFLVNSIVNIKTRWYGMVANETNLHQCPNEVVASNYWQPYGLQQWTYRMVGFKRPKHEKYDKVLFRLISLKTILVSFVSHLRVRNYFPRDIQALLLWWFNFRSPLNLADCVKFSIWHFGLVSIRWMGDGCKAGVVILSMIPVSLLFRGLVINFLMVDSICIFITYFQDLNIMKLISHYFKDKHFIRCGMA